MSKLDLPIMGAVGSLNYLSEALSIISSSCENIYYTPEKIINMIKKDSIIINPPYSTLPRFFPSTEI